MSDISSRIESLLSAKPVAGNGYYAFTVLLAANGGIEFSTQTMWVGYADEARTREIRKASLVNADRMLQAWGDLGESGMVVNDAEDMALFLAFGGNAVVERVTAEGVVPDWLAPAEAVNVGEWGFASPGLLGDAAMRRAPSAKHRMKILQRDSYRCRVCGRSPNDHVDVELHVHHIRPWAAGGVTVDDNLITLCHTCHNGLDPHFDRGLFRLLHGSKSKEYARAYKDRLHQYQAAMAAPERTP